MDATDWLARFAERLGVPAPTAAQTEDLLALAGVAAHSSQRLAAPLACWLTACAGIDPAQALAQAREVADDA